MSFMAPLKAKVTAFFSPTGSVASVASPSLASDAVASSSSAAGSDYSTYGIYAGIALLIAGVWYFFTKKGDKRSSHRF